MTELLLTALAIATPAAVVTQVQAQEERVRHIAPANPVVADQDVTTQPIPRRLSR